MTSKKYEAVMTYDLEEEGMLNEVMTPSGERWGPIECADLLNAQAETIEVLREWIRKDGKILIEQEREIIDDPEFNTPKDLEEAKLRLAALVGM